jgi:hypothetical protein
MTALPARRDSLSEMAALFEATYPPELVWRLEIWTGEPVLILNPDNVTAWLADAAGLLSLAPVGRRSGRRLKLANYCGQTASGPESVI